MRVYQYRGGREAGAVVMPTAAPPAVSRSISLPTGPLPVTRNPLIGGRLGADATLRISLALRSSAFSLRRGRNCSASAVADWSKR